MTRHRFVILLMVVVNLFANDAVGNDSCNGITRGRHFVIVYTGLHINDGQELSLSVVTFSTLPTIFTVRSKHLINGAPFEETFKIETRGSKRIQLPTELVLDVTSNRSYKVVTVDSDADVSVYGLVHGRYSIDTFLSIPVKYLGDSYVATSYIDVSFQFLFAVVGVEENTTVGIVFTATVTFEKQTYFPGTTLQIKVDKHQVFQFVADLRNENIGGSTVTSDKPVAVFGGCRCASHPWSGCNPLSKQIVPVKSWGKTHIYTATGSSQDSAIYNVHIYYRDTVVNIPGRAAVFLQPGQYWQGEIRGSGVITTSEPASVVQVLQTINGSFVDPSWIHVPSVEQCGREFEFSTPPKYANDDEGFFNYLNIVVTKGESKHVLLNNRPLSHYGNNVTSYDIPGIGYEVFIVRVPNGEAVYFVEQDSVTNTSPLPVVVYGYEYFETYGYAAGLSLPSNERLLTFNPFFLREAGREQLVVTLPCVESNDLINQTTTFCSFHAHTEESEDYTDVEAHFLDSYTLICSTPMFYEVEYLLLDKNRTVTFRGNLYVASQDVLPPTGGGTADAVGPGNSMNLGTFLHYFYDVLPWFSCCKLSNQCDEYYIYRPSDDCSTYVPPIPTGGTGDPHFKSLDGKDFTFNGAGEFLLLRSSLDNTIFQVRMEILPGTKASVYTAFVLSSNSSVPVQIQRSPLNDTLVVVDGNPLDMYYNGFLIHRQNFKGLLIEVNSDVSEVRIRLRSGVALVVRITTEMMSFILQLPDLFKRRVEGLLGNFNGDPNDDLISRNGSTVSSNSSLEVIHYELGLSWILDEHNSIFTYFPPLNFLSFHMPYFTPYLEFPNPNNVSDDVVALCGDSPPCLIDAVSTGSLSFANETRKRICDLETVIEYSVKIISCGFPGKVANGYINGSVYLVGYNITVICEEGFFLIGSWIMTCQEDGNWSSSLPTCNEDFSLLEPWALGVIITISVIIFIVMLSISSCLIRRQHMKKYNVKEVTNQVEEKTPHEYVYEKNVESKVNI